MQKKNNKQTTSWEGVSQWYDRSVGKTGNYYHQTIVLPAVLKLLEIPPNTPLSLLDLACGQGVISRHLPPSMLYEGVDISPSLILSAKKQNNSKNCSFKTFDVTLPLPIEKKDFDYCVSILALQNMENPLKALQNGALHLKKGGKLIIVLNHPCFRIPRQSSWGVDETKDIQYRRLDLYQTSQKIPILAEPSKGKDSPITLSFHHPLSTWSKWLYQAGFAIEWMEELVSDKISTGRCAKRENRSRKEFPLFLAIRAIKKNS